MNSSDSEDEEKMTRPTNKVSFHFLTEEIRSHSLLTLCVFYIM